MINIENDIKEQSSLLKIPYYVIVREEKSMQKSYIKHLKNKNIYLKPKLEIKKLKITFPSIIY